MKNWKGFCGRLWILLTVVCLTALGFEGVTARADGNEWKILYISSYSYGWDGTQQQIDGIRDSVGEDCEIQYEFMDSESVGEEIADQMFYDRMEYRASENRVMNAVVASGEVALRFVLAYRETYFSGIPVVFMAVQDESLIEEALQQPSVYGVAYEPSFESNIDLAKMLNPDLKNMVAIVDNSSYGKEQANLFLACQKEYPELELSLINTSELTTIGVKRKIWHLEQKDTALLYLSMTINGQGQQYTLARGLEEVCDIAKLSVMTMDEAWMGKGTAGGSVVCLYLSGADAAKTALSAIKGGIPQEKLLPSPNEINLDESVLREYNVDLSRIPEEAHIFNHQPSFWERNSSAIKGAVFPCLLLLVLIAGFVYENHRRKKTLLQMEEMNQRLMESSQHDFLTQLPNRSKFTQDITNCVNAKIPCTVFMLDIDDFKSINDTMGHSAGDEVLQEISRRLKELESGSFNAYRFAGDEFTIIFRHTERSVVQVAAAKCRSVFEEPMEVRGQKRKVTGSIGVASYPRDAQDAEQLVVCADKAMYRVKKGGKNDFSIYEK